MRQERTKDGPGIVHTDWASRRHLFFGPRCRLNGGARGPGDAVPRQQRIQRRCSRPSWLWAVQPAVERQHHGHITSRPTEQRPPGLDQALTPDLEAGDRSAGGGHQWPNVQRSAQ